jgi:hypothetical protein
MKVVTSYNNFARAKIDHDMGGRFELPIYQSGTDVFRNFISNFKGNAIYRSGFREMLDYEDCAFIEFKFSTTQNYILVLTNLKMRFLSYDVNGNFGWVLDGGSNILEVTTPYTLAQSKEIALGRPAQNADVMVFCHNLHQPRKLTRTSANSFTFETFARLDDPFGLTYAATVNISAITQAANALVTTAAPHGLVVGDMVKLAAITGMTQLNNYTARVVTAPTGTTFTIDVNTTAFTAYSSGGTTAKLLTGDYPACSLFYKGRLYYGRSRLKITTIWGSETGKYDNFTLPTTVTDSSAMQFTIADISQRIEWLFGGDNSLIVGSADGIVAVNGGGVGTAIKADTVQANLTSADGCNSAYPLKKDGLIFYVGSNNRNLYYFSYDLLTETFIAKDANFISYDITLGGFSKIRFKKDRNNLIFAQRGDGDLCSVNFSINTGDQIIGWHEANTYGTFNDMAVIGDNLGNPQFFVLAFRNGAYYIECQAEYVEFAQRVDFFTGKTQKKLDDEAYNRYVAEQLKQCIYLDNAQEYSDLRSVLVTYDEGAGTVTAGSSSFQNTDEGKHIVYKTITGYESGRFLITNYVSPTVVDVQVLQEPTSNTYSSWYLTFSEISGISQYNGQTIGVVTDGGYLSDFDVSGGEIAIGSQVTHAVIGYRYKGIIKSFCLGFQVQGSNTQTTFKAISRVGMRMVASAGGEFGSSLYKLEAIQELSQNDLNYLPPLPIDGTKYVSMVDDNTEDKYFYIVQDAPLPLHVAAVMIEANYAVSS